MIFTENDYKKIQSWLTAHSLKDSDFDTIDLAELSESKNNITIPIIKYSDSDSTYNNNRIEYNSLVQNLDSEYSSLYLRREHNYGKEEEPFNTYWADAKGNVVYKSSFSGNYPAFYSITKKPVGGNYQNPIISLTELTYNYIDDPYGGSIRVQGWETERAFKNQESPTLDSSYNYNGVRVNYQGVTEVGLGIAIPGKISITNNYNKSNTITGLYIGEDTHHANNKRGVFIEGKKDNDVLNAQGSVRKDITEYLGIFNMTSKQVEDNYLTLYEIAANKEINVISYQCTNPTKNGQPRSVVVHQTVEENEDNTITSYQHIEMGGKQWKREVTLSKSTKQVVNNTGWKKAPIIKTTIDGDHKVDEFNDIIIDTRIIAE